MCATPEGLPSTTEVTPRSSPNSAKYSSKPNKQKVMGSQGLEARLRAQQLTLQSCLLVPSPARNTAANIRTVIPQFTSEHKRELCHLWATSAGEWQYELCPFTSLKIKGCYFPYSSLWGVAGIWVLLLGKGDLRIPECLPRAQGRDSEVRAGAQA